MAQAISINLVPSESRVEQKRQEKFKLVQRISVAVLLAVIFFSVLTVALRILQTKNVQDLNEQNSTREATLTQLKDKEGGLVILKNRLDIISKIYKINTGKTLTYQSIDNIIPPGVSISSISLDQAENVEMSVSASNNGSLSQFLADLQSDKLALFSQIEVESLFRSRDGSYGANLHIIGVSR